MVREIPATGEDRRSSHIGDRTTVKSNAAFPAPETNLTHTGDRSKEGYVGRTKSLDMDYGKGAENPGIGNVFGDGDAELSKGMGKSVLTSSENGTERVPLPPGYRFDTQDTSVRDEINRVSSYCYSNTPLSTATIYSLPPGLQSIPHSLAHSVTTGAGGYPTAGNFSAWREKNVEVSPRSTSTETKSSDSGQAVTSLPDDVLGDLSSSMERLTSGAQNGGGQQTSGRGENPRREVCSGSEEIGDYFVRNYRRDNATSATPGVANGGTTQKQQIQQQEDLRKQQMIRDKEHQRKVDALNVEQRKREEEHHAALLDMSKQRELLRQQQEGLAR